MKLDGKPEYSLVEVGRKDERRGGVGCDGSRKELGLTEFGRKDTEMETLVETKGSLCKGQEGNRRPEGGQFEVGNQFQADSTVKEGLYGA